jgi:hypothetical protein
MENSNINHKKRLNAVSVSTNYLISESQIKKMGGEGQKTELLKMELEVRNYFLKLLYLVENKKFSFSDFSDFFRRSKLFRVFLLT